MRRKIFVFDFDGTLIHSNEIKTKCFLSLCRGANETEFMNSLINNKEFTRYEILGTFCNKFRNYDKNQLIIKFNNKLDQLIKNCRLRTGALSTLRFLNENNNHWHINSATPLENLLKNVNYFFDVKNQNILIGGEINKLESLYLISKKLDLRNNSEILFVGDGIDDYSAALEFGCDFLGVVGGTLEMEMKSSVKMIDDLSVVLTKNV